MPVTREQAIQLASDYYASRGFIVLGSRTELEAIQGDYVLVLVRAVHSTEIAFDFFDAPGRFWWIAFDALEREAGEWVPPSIHPSGGLVRVDEDTGELYHPTLL